MARLSPFEVAGAEILLAARNVSWRVCANVPRLRGATNRKTTIDWDDALECAVFQVLFCVEAFSHCRKAASLGESVFASGETR